MSNLFGSRMLPWLKSVFNEVIEAGSDLANEFEPNREQESNPKASGGFLARRDRSKSTPISGNHPNEPVLRTASQNHILFERKNIFEGVNSLSLGVTPLLKEYVSNLCLIPETWIDFPMEDVLEQKLKKLQGTAPKGEEESLLRETFTMTDKQEAHAMAILKELPQLNELRYTLVPRHLSDEKFWRIYFLLVSNKFQLSDSDENFRMPELQKSEHSLSQNCFYMRYAHDESSESEKKLHLSDVPLESTTFSFARKNTETLSIEHPPSLLGEHPIYWWHANEKGSRNMSYDNSFVHDTHGKQGAESNWIKLNTTELKQDKPKIFKLLLRCGVPDDFRFKAWKASPSVSICLKQEVKTPRFSLGKQKSPRKNEKIEKLQYDELLRHVFGDEVPLSCNPIPNFGGNLSFHQRHYLSHNGVLVVRRILILLALQKPLLHYAPILTDLVPLLVSFMAEDDAYELACTLIDESLERCHYIPLGNRHIELFGITFSRLVQDYYPNLLSHMESIGVSAKKLFTSWSVSLFVGSLPYQTVLRVLDCLFYEGSTVLYRVALAILSKNESALMGCQNTTEFSWILGEAMKVEYIADELLSRAWKHKLKHERLVVIYKSIVSEGLLEDIPELEMEIIRLPNPLIPSSIASLQNFETIWQWIPQRFRLYEPNLIFSSEEHGFNLKTLVAHCEGVVPTLLFIKTAKKQRFGVFCAQKWEFQDHYYGSGESFLFTLNSEKRYSWCTNSNICYIRLTRNSVAFGGGNEGDGLRLDEELLHGQSYRSETYCNDPLHGSDDPEFKCISVEVYSFD